jgi:hypothetical protein
VAWPLGDSEASCKLPDPPPPFPACTDTPSLQVVSLSGSLSLSLAFFGVVWYLNSRYEYSSGVKEGAAVVDPVAAASAESTRRQARAALAREGTPGPA